MAKDRIFISRKLPLSPKGLEDFEVLQWPHERPPKRQEFIQAAADAHGIISLLSDPLDRETLQQLPRLKAIAQYAVGTNNIDLEYCQHHHIKVSSTPDVLTQASAHHALALLMALARQLPQSQKAARTGQWKTWEPAGHLGLDLQGIKIGLVGMGRIAQCFALKCQQAFDAEIFYHRKNPNGALLPQLNARSLPLDELLSSAQVISLHTPLTTETRHLIGRRELSLMKPNALLINTARGEVVDQKALEDELKKGRFFGVGLDVTEPEPLPLDSSLFHYDRVLITPHIASAEQGTREQMAKMVYEQIKRDLGK